VCTFCWLALFRSAGEQFAMLERGGLKAVAQLRRWCSGPGFDKSARGVRGYEGVHRRVVSLVVTGSIIGAATHKNDSGGADINSSAVTNPVDATPSEPSRSPRTR
jgi:hypothetical protein